MCESFYYSQATTFKPFSWTTAGFHACHSLTFRRTPSEWGPVNPVKEWTCRPLGPSPSITTEPWNQLHFKTFYLEDLSGLWPWMECLPPHVCETNVCVWECHRSCGCCFQRARPPCLFRLQSTEISSQRDYMCVCLIYTPVTIFVGNEKEPRRCKKNRSSQIGCSKWTLPVSTAAARWGEGRAGQSY